MSADGLGVTVIERIGRTISDLSGRPALVGPLRESEPMGVIVTGA